MACSSCAARNQAMSNLQSIPQPLPIQEGCTYTVEELQSKLTLALDNQNWSQVSYLRSAIGRYGVNCNEFNNYIL